MEISLESEEYQRVLLCLQYGVNPFPHQSMTLQECLTLGLDPALVLQSRHIEPPTLQEMESRIQCGLHPDPNCPAFLEHPKTSNIYEAKSARKSGFWTRLKSLVGHKKGI